MTADIPWAIAIETVNAKETGIEIATGIARENARAIETVIAIERLSGNGKTSVSMNGIGSVAGTRTGIMIGTMNVSTNMSLSTITIWS